MENEKVKIKIEIDFTYDSTALKIIKEEISCTVCCDFEYKAGTAFWCSKLCIKSCPF